MKIGICMSGLPRWGDRKYKMLKSVGYACVDYGMFDTIHPSYSLEGEEFVAFFETEKSLAAEAGIEISQVHGPWRWPPEDNTPENRKERMEMMQKSICATSLMGCKYWVIHPIMPFGVEDLGTEKEKETWDINMAFMRELLATAKEQNVVICLENMPMTRFSLGAPKDILRFVREINDPNFKICLDTGHVSVFHGLSPADALRELAGEVRVLHVHDNDGKADYHWVPGTGVIDWADFGKALREINFVGTFSFEITQLAKLSMEEAEEKYAELLSIAQAIVG